jgi:hypothetical protein
LILNCKIITHGVTGPAKGFTLSSQHLGHNGTDASVHSHQLLQEDIILEADVKKLLSRPAQGETKKFNWRRIWTAKGGRVKGSVCWSCHQNYVGRPGEACKDPIRLFRHKILGGLLEEQMDKVISHRKPYEDWMYGAWISHGCQSWEKEGDVQSPGFKIGFSNKLLI